MQTCYNCGKQVDDNVLICPECGALVRRYGRVEREEPEMAIQPTGAAEADGRGARVKLSRGSKVWLVLCVLAVLVELVGFVELFYIYANQAAFSNVFGQFPELAVMQELLNAMMESVAVFWWFYALEGLLLVVKSVGLVWFLAGKRRRAFYLAAIPAGGLAILALATSGFVAAAMNALDVVVLYALIRKVWKRLPA